VNKISVSIPDFQKDYGADWTAFLTIWQSLEDSAIKASWDLYRMVDIDMMPVEVVEICLEVEEIPYDADDSKRVKAATLRTYPDVFRRKALATLYRNACKEVTGLIPEVKNAKKLGGERYDYSRCGEYGDEGNDIARYGMEIGQREIYIVLPSEITSDQMIDLLTMYRKKWLRPAFYDLFIVDKFYNIMETV